MIEEDDESGEYLVICDTRNCNHEDDYDTDGNWDELMRQMRLDGWKSKRVDGEWKNYCPECAAKAKEKKSGKD